MDTIEGKAALVTGASRGLGEALAAALAARGARVVSVARGERALSEAVERIRRGGGEAHALPADIGQKEDIHRIAGAAAALVGPIELLIHNASSLGPVPLRPLLDTECEDFEAVLQTNLVGPFRLSKVVAGAMALRRAGTVVHLSSDAAVSPYPGWGAYGVSKAAFDHLARIFAVELEGTGVRFLSIDPGEMDTRMHHDAIPEADRSTLLAPFAVAERIVALLSRAEPLPSGARVEAGQVEGARR